MENQEIDTENDNVCYEPQQIIKAIHKSQRCQRNYDLSKTVPEEHIEVFKIAATQCPSKQNVAHYKVHFITDRETISKIHEFTPTEKVHDLSIKTTNSQVNANLLIVFEKYRNMSSEDDQTRNAETTMLYHHGIEDTYAKADLERDANVAVGIAAGYLNLTASLLGYRSGCCQCMDLTAIKDLLGLESNPTLLMGIGFNNENTPRRLHGTDSTYVFPTRKKQEIPVTHIK